MTPLLLLFFFSFLHVAFALAPHVDWRAMPDGSGRVLNLVSADRSAVSISFCDSCWAVAVTTMLADRIKIARLGEGAEAQLSPQLLLNCAQSEAGSCLGGDTQLALQWIQDHGIVDETCQPYQATDLTCTAEHTCMVCKDRETPCAAQLSYAKYGVSSFGSVTGEDAIMQEIAARGPVSCALSMSAEFFAFNGTGVFVPTVPTGEINHEVGVAGFGSTAAGQKYWIVRNFLNQEWGNKGWAYVLRGNDSLGIESTGCSWAEPILPAAEAPRPRPQVWSKRPRRAASTFEPCYRPSASSASHVVSELPSALLRDSDLPHSYDIRNISGRNYMSLLRQQHLPQYCGACWAFATTSALSMRYNLARGASYPLVELSPQNLISCKPTGNGCHGGNGADANQFMRDKGVVLESCKPYQADDKVSCAPLCSRCLNPQNATDCAAVAEPTTFSVDEFGDVSGETAIMKELVARGPVSCGIAVTDAFENYQGGIYSEKSNASINHLITIIGYGEERHSSPSGTQIRKFWIVLNSWGSFWGEAGLFRIARGVPADENLQIETDCHWATPGKMPVRW